MGYALSRFQIFSGWQYLEDNSAVVVHEDTVV